MVGRNGITDRNWRVAGRALDVGPRTRRAALVVPALQYQTLFFSHITIIAPLDLMPLFTRNPSERVYHPALPPQPIS
ncbi:hypothetical protein J6590_072395 [Homalodisca vitripennis]|nr:hypothetical protein J6590_072395 [Homalodisca vitripennis]